MLLVTVRVQKRNIHISKVILNSVDFQAMEDMFTSKYTDKWLVKQKIPV